MLLVCYEIWKQACSNLESILLVISDRTSPTGWWVERRPPDLMSHLASLLWISTIHHLKALPAHNGGFSLQGGLFDTDITPCLSLLILHFFFLWLPDSLWRLFIFSQEAQRPLTSLDAAPSCRFPSWPCHKWQTLTKPQVCAESSFLVCVSCAVTVCCVSNSVDGNPPITQGLWPIQSNFCSCFLSTTGGYGWNLSSLNSGKTLLPVNYQCSV